MMRMDFLTTNGIHMRFNHFVKSLKAGIAVALMVPMLGFAADGGEDDGPKFAWQSAPGVGKIADKAQIELTGDLLFLEPGETSKFMVFNGNPATEDTVTLASNELKWFAVFDVISEGYVKDDEAIDADALLDTLKDNNKESLKQRREQNMPLLFLDGWHIAPHYDKATRRLEWATRLHDEKNNPIINFTTRILGRTGYVSATLVSDPQNLDRDIASFKQALTHFDYVAGERYSEFTSGDKVAAYGLGALVVGGAAAAVASKGGFKFLAYIVVAAFAAVGGFFKKLFGKKDD